MYVNADERQQSPGNNLDSDGDKLYLNRLGRV